MYTDVGRYLFFRNIKIIGFTQHVKFVSYDPL